MILNQGLISEKKQYINISVFNFKKTPTRSFASFLTLSMERIDIQPTIYYKM